jgi:hypothetical protein
MSPLPPLSVICNASYNCDPFFLRLTLRSTTTTTTTTTTAASAATTDAASTKTLTSAASSVISTNDYWLSPTPDVNNWNASNFYRTPLSSYTNYTGLCHMPPARVAFGILPGPWLNGSTSSMHIQLENTSPGVVAFFVHLRVTSLVNDRLLPRDVLPVYWDDNYVTLFPGEVRPGQCCNCPFACCCWYCCCHSSYCLGYQRIARSASTPSFCAPCPAIHCADDSGDRLVCVLCVVLVTDAGDWRHVSYRVSAGRHPRCDCRDIQQYRAV